jgi:hypothetical protein
MPRPSRSTVKILQANLPISAVLKLTEVAMFQIVCSELDPEGKVVAQWAAQPLYELEEDALAIAEFDALRLSEDGRLDASHDGLHATDPRGRMFRIEVNKLPEGVEFSA